jgi:hypothetical protein
MRRQMNCWIFFFSILLTFFILFGTGCDSLKGPKGDKGDPGSSSGTGGTWQNATTIFEDNLCMIGIIDENEDYVTQIGTGWAIEPDKIITNAHVAYGVYDFCRNWLYGLNSEEDRIVAVKNNTYTGDAGTYELIECAVHTGYNNLNPFSNDFAVFTIDTSGFAANVTIASSSTLQSLFVGQVVGTMGYPGEMSSGMGDEYLPIATFKDGTISALRPYNQLPSGNGSTVASFDLFSSPLGMQAGADRVIVQTNFNTTGGTSGSPVFLQSGEVISINNAGMAIYVIDYYGDIVTVSLGSLDFGVRIDERTDIETTMPYQVNVSDFRNTDPSEYAALDPGQYRINLSWSGWSDFDLWVQIGDNSQYIGSKLNEDELSRAYIYPFLVHYGDNSSYGPEYITLLQLVQDVTVFAWSWDWDLFSNYSTVCQIVGHDGVVAEIDNPPSGYEDFWIIGTLKSNGTFIETNELTYDGPLYQTKTNVLSHLKAIGVNPEEGDVIHKRNPKP